MLKETLPREALRHAQGARERAREHIERVSAAIGRAQRTLEIVIRDSQEVEAASRKSAEQRADRLLATLRGSATVDFADDDNAAGAYEVKGAAYRLRRATAERALAELQHELAEAEGVLTEIDANVARLINAVLRLEARKIADRWAHVDAEARVLRQRLGRIYGAVHKFGETAGTPIGVAIQANETDSLNLEQHVAVNDVWTELAAALMTDPEARPDWGPVDRLREQTAVSNAEQSAGVAAIVERMAAEGARLQ